MATQFPKPNDRYPVVSLKDTDYDLPKSAVNNKMRYAYFKTIAQGGKCIIQSCKDLHLSRTVCYKSLRREIADDPIEQQRFLREARVTAMLQHPNTIPIYELSRDTKGHYYFTMKLVEGATLREIINWLKEGDPKTTEQYGFAALIDVIVQICNALDYAHNHGVVHRDIKPANILIGPFGEVLVLDWGLAKVWNIEERDFSHLELIEDADFSLTSKGRLQGTALYMSPEQIAASKDIDHRTDIYSVGAVLYEALTLELMAWGKTLNEMLQHIKFDDPPPPREKAPHRNIPEELERICLKCINKDPEKRYTTISEVIEALQTWRMRVEELS
ncbi:MAG: serine/threonine protein kinase [Rhodothermaceae bacterium]|nr:serine/threonine protein kinase [Rhodothermaceae bacterium]